MCYGVDMAVSCPSCGSNKLIELEKYETFTLHGCLSCDLQTWHPFKNPGSHFYEEHTNYIWRNHNPEEWNLYPAPRRFLSKKRRGETLLDIGMGVGKFLSAADLTGYRVTGFDFNKDSVQVAKDHYGLGDVHVATLDEFMKEDRKFDVITMFELIEHLDDFDTLLKIRDHLNESGLLVLSTPWRGRWTPFMRGDTPPHHLSRFSDESIKNVLETRGFKVTEIWHSPIVFSRYMMRFSEWTKGYLSFGIAEKLTKNDSPRVPGAQRKKTIKQKIIRALSLVKLYGLFMFPALILYVYLSLTGGRNRTGMYVEARRQT